MPYNPNKDLPNLIQPMIYQFKVTLDKIKPTVWRRMQVPVTYNFWDLHVAIQDAMGWEDCHSHNFKILNPYSMQKEHIGIPAAKEVGYDDYVVLPGWATGISAYFSNSNTKADYEYDCGDIWTHQIILEKILSAELGMKYPRCIDGKRACPPEDCGGSTGYGSFLQSLQDPGRKTCKGYKQLVVGDFDPEDFNASSVQFSDPQKRWERAFKKAYLI